MYLTHMQTPTTTTGLKYCHGSPITVCTLTESFVLSNITLDLQKEYNH